MTEEDELGKLVEAGKEETVETCKKCDKDCELKGEEGITFGEFKEVDKPEGCPLEQKAAIIMTNVSDQLKTIQPTIQKISERVAKIQATVPNTIPNISKEVTRIMKLYESMYPTHKISQVVQNLPDMTEHIPSTYDSYADMETLANFEPIEVTQEKNEWERHDETLQLLEKSRMVNKEQVKELRESNEKLERQVEELKKSNETLEEQVEELEDSKEIQWITIVIQWIVLIFTIGLFILAYLDMI